VSLSDIPQLSSLFGVPVTTEECFSSDVALYKLSVSATEKETKKERKYRKKKGRRKGRV